MDGGPLMASIKLLLTLEEAAHAAGISTSMWKKLVATGRAPKPRDPTGSSARWLVREVEAWVEGLPVANNLPPKNTGHGNRGKRTAAGEGAAA